MSNDLHTIYWSGGLDSTFIVYDYLKSKQNFRTVYVKISNANQEKSELELNRRTKIKELFVEYFHVNWDDSIIEYTPSTFILNNCCSKQALIWLESTFNLFNYNKETFVFGYMRRDDFWHYKQDFINMHKMYQVFSHYPTVQNELLYPLEWFDKEDIIKNIDINDQVLWKNLFKQIWTCEDVKAITEKKHCKTCTSCQKLLSCIKLFNSKINQKEQIVSDILQINDPYGSLSIKEEAK